MPVYKQEVNKLVRIFFGCIMDCFSPRSYGLSVKAHTRCMFLSWVNFKTIFIFCGNFSENAILPKVD